MAQIRQQFERIAIIQPYSTGTLRDEVAIHLEIDYVTESYHVKTNSLRDNFVFRGNYKEAIDRKFALLNCIKEATAVAQEKLGMRD